MSTVQVNKTMDASSAANFSAGANAWAPAVSAAMLSLGWAQNTDKGQAVFTATVLTLTQVVGATATYSYSSFTGPTPRVGMVVMITGFVTGGNNVNGYITACSGGASGTFQLAVTTQADETHAGTGTVVQSLLTVTQVTVGATAVYSYNAYIGAVPHVNMLVTVTGMVASGGANNVANMVITAHTLNTSFTAALTTQVNETHAGVGAYTVCQHPVTNSYCAYEVWKSTDTLSSSSPLYIKISYGRDSNSMPTVNFDFATSTDGLGNMTGNTITGFRSNNPGNSDTGGGASLYEWDFSGAAGQAGNWLAILGGRNFANVGGSFFVAVERSQDSTGAYTNAYWTIVTQTAYDTTPKQQTLFKAGGGTTSALMTGSICCINSYLASNGLSGNIPFFPIYPLIGKVDNPLTVAGVMGSSDQTEGATFTISLYGNTRTYMFSKSAGGSFTKFGANGANNNNMGVCMRWD